MNRALLLVEDSDVQRQNFALALRAHGWTVDEAPDGKTALGFLRVSDPYAAIVLDLRLPDMHGFELIQTVRSEGLQSPAVIVVSAYVDPVAQGRLIEFKVDGLLPKPVAAEVLAAAIDAICAGNETALVNLGAASVEPARLNSDSLQLYLIDYGDRRGYVYRRRTDTGDDWIKNIATLSRPVSLSDKIQRREAALRKYFTTRAEFHAELETDEPLFVVARRWNSWYPSFFDISGGAYAVVGAKGTSGSARGVIIDPGFRSLSVLNSVGVPVGVLDTCVVTQDDPDHIEGLFEYLASRRVLGKGTSVFCSPSARPLLDTYRGALLEVRQLGSEAADLVAPYPSWDGQRRVVIRGVTTSHRDVGVAGETCGILIASDRRESDVAFQTCSETLLLGDTEYDPREYSPNAQIFRRMREVFARPKLRVVVLHVGCSQFRGSSGKHLYLSGLIAILKDLEHARRTQVENSDPVLVVVSEWGLEHASAGQLKRVLPGPGNSEVIEAFGSDNLTLETIRVIQQLNHFERLTLLPGDVGLVVGMDSGCIYLDGKRTAPSDVTVGDDDTGLIYRQLLPAVRVSSPKGNGEEIRRSFRYDVLFACSAKDKGIVRGLAQRLKDDGLHVWFDEWEILPGESIEAARKRALEQSRILILALSANAFGSEWSALERQTIGFRDAADSDRRFIPVRLDSAAVKDTVGQFAYVDWREQSEGEYLRLLAACKARRLEGVGPESTVIGGHSSPVCAIDIAPDGRMAATGYDEGTVRIWDVASGTCSATLLGHLKAVRSLAFAPDVPHLFSCSDDGTIRIWDATSGACTAVLHDAPGPVNDIAVTPDGLRAISAHSDAVVRLWKPMERECIARLTGHGGPISAVAISSSGRVGVSGSMDGFIRVWDLDLLRSTPMPGHPDGILALAISDDCRTVVSAAHDRTIRVWDVNSYSCVATLEGHTESVTSIALSHDGRTCVSGSDDRTLRIWELRSGRCLAVLEGHAGGITGVAISNPPDLAVSASTDGTLRLWPLSRLPAAAQSAEMARYTNARVILLGDSGVGKTSLAIRLSQGRFAQSESTHGLRVFLIELTQDSAAGIERDVWLCDLPGQADYRLIHQLYLDQAAVVILVFDPSDENLFETLSSWDKALEGTSSTSPVKLLVAARCDRSQVNTSRRLLDQFCQEHGYAGYFATSALTGDGCADLREAITHRIPWDRIPWTSSSRVFKSLRESVLRLKDSDTAIVRFPELRQQLQLHLPGEPIDEQNLRTVIALMGSQGFVQPLDFGDYVLLQPEWLNHYASALVRTLRQNPEGAVAEQEVLDGHLDFHHMPRLPEGQEQVLLRALVQTFLNRSLCLREQTVSGPILIFPSYLGRDQPEPPSRPQVPITYGFRGRTDEVYATLVVRLSRLEGIRLSHLWKHAAELSTPDGAKASLSIDGSSDLAGVLSVYFEDGVPDETKLLILSFIQEHLLRRAQEIVRVREYVCPHCQTPLKNREAVRFRLEQGSRDIICPTCGRSFLLADITEDRFASSEFRRRLRELDERANIRLDSDSRELILIGHAMAVAAEAGHIFRRLMQPDIGVDAEIEFRTEDGNASGARAYLQLKMSDYYSFAGLRNGSQVLVLKDARIAEAWRRLSHPVLLLDRSADGGVLFMDVTAWSRGRAEVPGTPSIELVYCGETFSAPSLLRLRKNLDHERAERDAELASELAASGLKEVSVGNLDAAFASFTEALARHKSNSSALSGLLTVAARSTDESASRMNLALARLIESSPSWLAAQVCATVEFAGASIDREFKARLRPSATPLMLVASATDGFGWDVELSAVETSEAGLPPYKLALVAKRIEGEFVELTADTSTLPWGLYVARVRFLVEGREQWGVDQTVANKEPPIPYVAGPPIRTPELFFGREEMLRDVVGLLEEYSIVLLGPRRSGKTSFLYRLADTCVPNWLPVMIDLHSFLGSETPEVLAGLRREILEACCPGRPEPSPVDLHSLKRRLRDAGVHRMLILVDEIAVLARHPEVAMQLRALSNWQDPICRLLAAGTAGDLERATSAALQIGSPPFNVYVKRELDLLSWQHAQDLLTAPVLGLYRYEPEALELLQRLGGGQPFFLNVLGQQAIRAVQREKERVIRRVHADCARKEAVYELDPWFREFVAELDLPTREALPVPCCSKTRDPTWATG